MTSEAFFFNEALSPLERSPRRERVACESTITTHQILVVFERIYVPLLLIVSSVDFFISRPVAKPDDSGECGFHRRPNNGVLPRTKSATIYRKMIAYRMLIDGNLASNERL